MFLEKQWFDRSDFIETLDLRSELTMSGHKGHEQGTTVRPDNVYAITPLRFTLTIQFPS